MTKYREILRLYSQGISQRSIALSCECSRNTVAKVIARAKELNINWPLSPEQTRCRPGKTVFPQRAGTITAQVSRCRTHPQGTYAQRSNIKVALVRIL
jgi:transposase